MTVFTPEQEAFLTDHVWAVLATGRKDGSPQVSMIGYAWDGSAILVSIKSYTAKWRNALRQPRVALLVHEGRKQLVIYGRAQALADDPERLDVSRQVFERLSGKPVDVAEDEFRQMLDGQKRTVLKITPESAMMND